MKNTVFIFIILPVLLLSGCYRKIEQKITNTVDKVDQIRETIIPQPTIIESDGLPNKHLIKTAFVPQAPEKNWDQPWQDACEEAAILTVYYYYHSINPSTSQIITDLNQLFQTESELGFTHDVNITQISTVSAKLYNFKSEIINNPTINQIKQYISQDIPVIVPANGKILFKENNHFKSGGPWYHHVVILGYDDNKQQFIVHDVGTQFGAYFHYSYDLILQANHDFPPSGIKEDINKGDQTILILLK